MSPSRKACVASALSLYPDARPLCITRASSFYSPAFKVIPWDSVMGQLAAFLRVPKDAYAWTDPMCFSDWARFWFLAHNPDTLYLDTDCRLKARFDFKDRPMHAGIFLLYASAGFDGLALLRMLKARSEKRLNLLNDFGEKLGWEELPAFWYQHG
jgi:hypothetical protein